MQHFGRAATYFKNKKNKFFRVVKQYCQSERFGLTLSLTLSVRCEFLSEGVRSLKVDQKTHRPLRQSENFNWVAENLIKL